MKAKSNDTIEMEGVVTTLYPNTIFQIKLDNGADILGHLSGKMRKRYIKLTVGDRVRVEISKYDITKGRIVYRLNTKPASAGQKKSTHTNWKRHKH